MSDDVQAQALDEKGWVVECDFNSLLHYWTGRPIGSMAAWSIQNQEALRFARRADAELMLTYHCKGIGRVVEHLWCGKAASDGE